MLFLVIGTANSQSTLVNQVDSTALVVIGNVDVEGNYRTRTTIILREMALKPGDTLRAGTLAEQLEIDRRKIVNTNLFVTVEMQLIPQETVPDDGLQEVHVRVVVKERWYFLAIPVFQLADRNFNEWWYDRDRDLRRVTYGLYLSYNNLTGRADRLRFLAEFGFIPKYEMTYSVPYIDKAQTIGISTGISYTTNKSLPYRTWRDKLDYFNSENLNRERFYTFVSLTRRSKFYTFHSLDLRWNYIGLSDTIAALNPNYLLQGRDQQQYFQLSYILSHDRRDNVQYPLRGQTAGVQISKLGILPSDDLNLAYIYGWYRRYTPLSKRWFVNNGLRGRISLPRRQPYLQTLGMGYRSDLVRGYELYVVDGQHYALLQNELKFKIFDIQKHFPWVPIRQFNTIPLAAYLNTFADAGYVRNYYPERSNTRLGNSLLYGAGLGLDLVTFYNMTARFNVTVNGMGERRFFFSFGRQF
ncbi:BamA/TamA family outer membrane protein [Telluribacter sp.]|uniref:BamA/TamA family outer membrane protein n=1 Tax=Telluribacter sp. TaxID=1978767 RepID=UPI002E1325F6|nr:BamA/TamA family outer membrane protein [Telluribacter sp.]